MSSSPARKTQSTKNYTPPSASSPKTRAAFTLQRSNSDQELKIVQKFKITQEINDDDVTSGPARSTFNPPPNPANTSTSSTPPPKPNFKRRSQELLTFVPELVCNRLRGSPLPPSDPNYTLIHRYIEQGQGSRKRGPGMKILQILKMNSKKIPTASNSDQGQRKMLWLSVPRTDAARILENKFHPFEIGVEIKNEWDGKAYSDIHRQQVKGLHLYDIAFRNGCIMTDGPMHPYAYWPREGETAYLFLCQMWLQNKRKVQGTWWKIWEGENEVEDGRTKFTMGKWHPDPKGNEIVDGVVWPLGSIVENNEAGWLSESWNTYHLINPKEFQYKYLVKVKFTWERYYH